MTENNLENPQKRICLEKDHIETKNATEDNLSNDIFSLNQFEVTRVINASESSCSITVEAKVKDKDGVAVVTLQKLPFESNNINNYFISDNKMRSLFHNDVYYNKMAHIPSEMNEVKASIIYPAEEKHIKKFEADKICFIMETPELYSAVTHPFIISESFNKQWIYNILEHKKEKDRIIYEDLDEETGFVLVPDLKWSGEQIDNLYLQAIVVRRDILSIRELRAEHIPLLKNIFSKCTAAIEAKYDLKHYELRAYFHYQPSFYHLHVHFSALTFDAPGIHLGKAHHIQDVISNLENDGEHYAKALLSFTIKNCHPLSQAFDNYGYFSKVTKNGSTSK